MDGQLLHDTNIIIDNFTIYANENIFVFQEVGLVVIDEVHMIGEDSGRGANLESFITKIKYMNRYDI